MSDYIGAKFDKNDVELLRKIVRERREDVSSFLRRVVREEFARLGYLSEEESKALGIETERKVLIPA